MITPECVRRLAAYNAWQNRQLDAAMGKLDHAALLVDRGAFWGSILGTANHLLWGDATWMARFGVGAAPERPLADSAALFPTHPAWSAERFRLDGRITLWAEELRAVDLVGRLRWYSGAAGREIEKPVGEIVLHMFNHQTHHRGQIHAMLGAAGVTAPVSDLFLMPEDG
ncbi:damage-inducible protein DinB [Lutimaribacter sp. EGI FJ00015]|uniref:Damage-inducible protein DinB n=1 Tax=Lutimaribacter degradans TaxID=2945989 RepID=A0ACC5ZVZ6_9RHOB|nr:DinB family protein [Lutimaribacter sp. EGI FJ00013]MCM2562481.1 damage-inducible protein DinB [Lutimaribacter sp. EGI FJ00013]MCO0613638.1 damage-inducible protein DinB [Lutimaribacter sp. EGI FJ00015]MCO0636610.1 damage-inducible protein DinB [Lutimaribacter sp. EGI FJ00014]